MISLTNPPDIVGRNDEAVELREELLAIHLKVNGPEHPDTLNAMSTLAIIYRAKGEVAKAEALEKEIAAIKAKAKPAAPTGK